MQGLPVLQDKLKGRGISYCATCDGDFLESTITAFHGNENLQSVDIKNFKTGVVNNFKVDGTFIFTVPQNDSDKLLQQ